MQTSDNSPTYLAQQRLCVAEMMDAHPDVFAASSSGRPWSELVAKGVRFAGPDRRVADKALGVISALFRTAQASLGDAPTPGQIFAADRSGAAETIEPDAQALDLLGADAAEDPESMALAKSVTLYKQAASVGLIDQRELASCLDAALEAQPENTPLARTAKQVARRITELELSHLLRESAPEVMQ